MSCFLLLEITPDLSAMSLRYKRVLHNDDDAISTSNNFREEMEQVASIQRERINSPPERVFNTHHHKSTELSRSNDYDEHEIPQDKPKKKNSRIPQSKIKRSNKPTATNSSLLPDKLFHRDRTIDEVQAELVDDYLVPFHRTETANMYDSQEHHVSHFKRKNKAKKPQSNELSPRAEVNRSIKAAKSNRKKQSYDSRRTGAVSEPSKSPKIIQGRNNRPSSWTNQVRE